MDTYMQQKTYEDKSRFIAYELQRTNAERSSIYFMRVCLNGKKKEKGKILNGHVMCN